MNKTGKRYALKVVSNGIIDDLFALRFSMSDTKFRWDQAKKLGERRNSAEKMIKLVGNSKRAEQVAMQITDPQIKKFVLSIGRIGIIGFGRRRKINLLVRNVFMAESRGSHQAARNYINQARKWGIIK